MYILPGAFGLQYCKYIYLHLLLTTTLHKVILYCFVLRAPNAKYMLLLIEVK